MNSQRILLVEGESDRDFCQELVCNLRLNVTINPKTPRDVCESVYSNGVDVLRTNALPKLLSRLATQQITHLGIIIDADTSAQGYGFNKRREQFTNLFVQHGYIIPETSCSIGELFLHSKQGIPPVGLRIMPNHQQDGMLEDLLINNLNGEQQKALLAKANKTIEELGNLCLFKNTQFTKAQLATILAWQRKPGLSISKAYKAGIFDLNGNDLIQLIRWLKVVFNQT